MLLAMLADLTSVLRRFSLMSYVLEQIFRAVEIGSRLKVVTFDDIRRECTYAPLLQA